MAPHATAPIPEPVQDWREWLPENARSFRRTLLLRRDGARLHAGSRPDGADLDRIAHKIAFLPTSGVPERGAQMALAAGRFTVGSVLEEQADTGRGVGADSAAVPPIDHESAFEAGLALILDGLTCRIGALISLVTVHAASRSD
ncbi:TetR/AcrR family transcriptional regulator C-terminal domain-containing protein [Streptomyces brasiliensis]|nr:TetR/AcrR family transcriptional regulator C-terminal domain-containing protein [Streptomyces brasiliensis]